MTAGTDRVTLHGLRIRGRHGVFPAEREQGQDFLVDVGLRLDTRAAAARDDLAATVDYGGLAAAVADVVAGKPVALVETLAARVAETCLAFSALVDAVDVTVHKPEAPLAVPFADVTVTITRRRPRRVVLSLGGNLDSPAGDPAATLRSAVAALRAEPGLRGVRVSAAYETEPVGGVEQPPFLNAVVVADSDLDAEAVLDLAHRVEDAHGRRRGERWGPRTLDVDVIAVGTERQAGGRLEVPHPRAAERAFVLVPWLDLDPDAVLPGHGPVEALAAALPAQGVRRRDGVVLG